MTVCSMTTVHIIFLIMCISGYGSGALPSYRPPVVPPPGGSSNQYYNNNGPSQYSTSNGAPQVNAILFSLSATLS